MIIKSFRKAKRNAQITAQSPGHVDTLHAWPSVSAEMQQGKTGRAHRKNLKPSTKAEEG